MPLMEYERRFNQLSRYAPHLVDMDERKARRFEKCLNREIENVVRALRLPTYREVLERSQIVMMGNEPYSVPPQSRFLGKRRWDDRNKGKMV